MRLLLIRHANMAGDPYARPRRPVSGCLSRKGLAQARALARTLRDTRIDAALSSPYGRALQTAEIALAGRRVPIRILDALIEWQPNPELQNVASTVYERMLARDRTRYAEDTWKTELGEGCYDLYARAVPPFLQALGALGLHARLGGFVARGAARERTVAVFAHGGSLNVLLSHLLGVRPFPVGAFAFRETAVAALEFTERRGIFYPALRIGVP